MTSARIPPERSEPSADDAVARLMELTGDIALLPAGADWPTRIARAISVS